MSEHPSSEHTPTDEPARSVPEGDDQAAESMADGVPEVLSTGRFGTDAEYAPTSKLNLPRTDEPTPLPPTPSSSESWMGHITNLSRIPDLGALAGTTDTGDSRPHLVADEDPAEDARTTIMATARPGMAMRPWLLPLLLSATCLAVGMVLGALLYSNLHKASDHGSPPCPEPAVHKTPEAPSPGAATPASRR